GRVGAEAVAEGVTRLGIGAEHVVFGHTHRRGPLPGDDLAAGRATWAAGATSLRNTGSWAYAPALLGASGNASPYWPGTVVEVEDGEPPRARELLADLDEGELRRVLSAKAGQ
ncbi:MAG: hypothetical protein ACR2N5_04075, partial [Solirubrobacterales bacterium]